MKKTSQLLVVATAFLAIACDKSAMPIKTASAGETQLSPSADSLRSVGRSLVRVINAVDGGQNIAVRLGDLTIFPEVKAGVVTDYNETSTNLAQFSVRTATGIDGMMLAEKDRVLLDGSRYTVILMAEDSSRNSLRVIRDFVVPDSGKARIRLIHAAVNAPELDVSIAGSKSSLFSGVKFRSEAGYADVVPGVVSLDIRGVGETRVLLHLADLPLKRSTATTIIVTGTGKLHYIKFTDALMAAPTTP
jgi:hypothetical protein